ncbi:hypothetical protein VFA_003678 [Vibrio furnissii CIP 102972]|nr:hypothetical protein VFA_003678 [Vibrio furnissii CIP 102972]
MDKKNTEYNANIMIKHCLFPAAGQGKFTNMRMFKGVVAH